MKSTDRLTQRCVIIGGADIGRYDRIRACLREDDFYICCDKGLILMRIHIWRLRPLCFPARRTTPIQCSL